MNENVDVEILRTDDFAEVTFTFNGKGIRQKYRIPITHDMSNDQIIAALQPFVPKKVRGRPTLSGNLFRVPHHGEDTLVSSQTEKPPKMAEALFAIFSSKKSADAQLGDLQEMFEKDSDRFGVQRARRFYWIRVFKSIMPALVLKLRKIGVFGIIVDYARTKLGL
jgi:hypothetical protein